MIIQNHEGHYRFIKGIAPYSGGVAADSGFEIEHAQLSRTLPLEEGFRTIDSHFRERGLERTALCAIQLRSPRPFSFGGFDEFNAEYASILQSWGLLQDGLNPIARTNVAPKRQPPSVPSLHSFSYIVPASISGRSFVVSGAGELPEGSLSPSNIVRAGETTQQAMTEKARFVMGLMSNRLHLLGCDWSDVMTSNVYTVHDLDAILSSGALAQAAHIAPHSAHPPIIGIEFEMDLRGVRREIVIETGTAAT